MVANLYKKYKAEHYAEMPALNPLSYILSKAELGYHLTVSELEWLEHHQLVDAMEIIKKQENYRNNLTASIEEELIYLSDYVHKKIEVLIPKPSVTSDTALILYKIYAQEGLSDIQINRIGSSFNVFYQRFLDFNNLKNKLYITEDIPFDENVKSILVKLDRQKSLCSTEIYWIYTHNGYSYLNPPQNQFAHLQDKYRAIVQDGATYNLLLLCHILQKLEEKKLPDEAEAQYLKENGFIETLEIVQKLEFSTLKEKYRATQIQEDSISHHLYKVLKKLDAELALPEPDINYLKKRKLHETIKFAYKKEADSLIHKIEQGQGLRPDDVAWCEKYDFVEIVFLWLKRDYKVEHRKDTPENPLYLILKKLEAVNRLTDEDVVWLEGEKLLQPSNRIYIAHHTLEAQFYENEFQRTKDHWKLASASAHWRKAENSKRALKQTDGLGFTQIKPAKLRAALLTTRGGALRDIDNLNEAEKCALEAIKHFPDSHNPYTLMGALYYDSGRYDEGDRWFEEAIKRGAKPHDQDAEIKRILRKKTEQERKELIDHLLKKDPKRFAWVKDFAKKVTNRNK